MRIEWERRVRGMVNRSEPMVRQEKSLASKGSASANPPLSI